MKIISIKFLNLNSLKGEHNIRFDEPPFTESGLFAITGPTGAGKTTILDAITVGLYGRVHRHDKDASESMTRFTGESFAEVGFEVNDKLYRAKWSIRRSRSKPDGILQTPKMELADAITDAIIIAHPLAAVQSKIVEICGLDYHQFLRSVMLSQGDFTRFLKANENERSELLEKMTDTGIYSKISAYVFEKARDEKNLLETLRAKMNDVVLLSEEEKEAIAATLQQHKDDEARLKQIKQQADHKINWLQKVKGLEGKLQLHSDELKGLRQQAKDNEPQFEILNRHLGASLHRLALQAVNQQKNQKADIESKVAEIEKQLPGYKEEAEQVAVQLEASTLAHGKAQTALAEAEPLLEIVIIKDTETAGQKSRLQQAADAFTTLQKEAAKAAVLKQQKQDDLAACTAKILEAETWLARHHKESNLDKDLPAWQQKRKELLAADEALAKAKNELAKFGGQQKDEQSTLEKAIEKVGNAKKVIDDLTAKHIETKQKLEEESNEKLLEELESISNALPALIAVCSSQLRLSADYRKQLDKRQHVSQQLEDSNNKLNTESKQLKQLEIEKEKAESLLNDLQQLVELQMRIKKYDEDRGQLEPEKPCPLCGSIHHPYKKNDYKSGVNEAEQKRKAHKTYLEKLLKEHREKGLSVNTISTNISAFNDELRQIELTVEDVTSAFEKNNKELPKPLNIQDEKIISAIIVAKEGDFKKLREQITAIRNLQQLLSEQEKQINDKTQELVRFESAVLQIEERVKALKRDSERVQDDLNFSTEIEEKLVASAASLLSNYDIAYVPSKTAGYEEELKKRFTTYSTAIKNVQQNKTDIGKLEAEHEAAKTAHLDKTMQLQQQEVNLNDEEKSLQELQLKRRELFGEKNPSKERKRLNDDLQQAKSLVDKMQNELHHKEQVLKVSEEKSKEWNNQLQAAGEKYSALTNELLATLATEAIASIEALEALFIPAEEEKRIALIKQQIERSIAATTGILKNTDEEYKAEIEKNLTAESEEALVMIRAEQEGLISELNQQIGSLQHRLEEDAQLAIKHREVAAQAEEQQKECSRWDKISQLIGSADGKKFSKFAQGLTLARLTELANRHLHKLSDRYRILKSAEKDLELQIIDAYQADVVRPMTTLSGGESFLVSLSLALGLSDLAGSKTQINSLFIDEGFGTLDADTLDVAISALENLQASGKMIGIISHVEALKERIGTQIEVSKQPGGYSKIKVKSYGGEYALKPM